ncbi:arginase family protein [Kribbella sp. CA-293567]|uniref:arginase family protein n=1 Tax=Kribbella sp. CA-293567 TaxID=3002436 RepID=UPI0022DE74B0|nr:arginase family protein [Kribbella sp. CA-293567]WBQ07685.1 arginase family protein [Kribbella sp. CA-293567]
MRRHRAVLDGPSNLGLRPPAPGTVPGCHKLAGALRDQRFVERIVAADAGCVTPPRYDRGEWKPGDGVFNAAAMAGYTIRLADRIGKLLDDGQFVVLLGGECSNLLAPTLALRRRGRYGVVYLDGHSDFRTVDNDEYVGAAGGEALALVTGRGQDDLADLEGLRPYVRDSDAVMLGYREDEAYLDTMREAGIRDWSALTVIADPASAAGGVLEHLERDDLDGFWVHLDVDILDAEVMPAVDSPDPGGLQHEHLRELLRPLLASPKCVGLDIGIFDPDLDPDGRYAAALADTLVAALT